MRSKFICVTKVLAVCLPLALTFSLSACGDDSSSGANGDDVSGDDPGDGGEDNDRTKAYCSFEGDDWVIDVIEGSDEYIQWREGKAVVVSKKKMGSASTCKSMLEQGGLSGTCDDEGYLTTTLNVEKYASYSRDELRKMIKEEWYNCVSASGSKSSSSGKSDGKSSSSSNSGPQYENPFKDLKVGECNFKMEDKVWEYVSYSDNFGLGDEYKLHYYQYKDGGSIDSTYTYTFGSNARTLCRLDGDKDTSYTNNYGAKVHFKSWCTSDGMEEFEIQRNNEQDKSREAAFREFMTWCKELNDVSDESSSSTEGDDDSSSSEKPGESCKAKVDDEVWYFERDYSDQGIPEYYSIVTWDGNKATSKTVMAQKSQSESICKSTLSGLQAMKDNPGEKNEYVCDGATLIKTTTTDPFQYSNSEKKQYYESMMLSWCGIKVDASSSSTNSSSSGKAESSSSEKPSSSSVASSSSEAPKSSSSSKKTEITYPTKYGKSCEFKPEDDAWYVENKEVKYYAVYEWTGNTVKKTAVVFNVTDDAESCSTLKGMWPECSAEGSSCACDNEILVVTTTVQEEVESKTDAYVAAMYDQCGILVEIESSSSSVVNNCGFEKTDAEWTFITDEVTEIFTWDSNDQYIFTHIARETYEDDEIYEGCEDCKTGAVKCVEEAAIATEEMPEDDDYTYTYTCKGAEMSTTSVSKNKFGDSDERDRIFAERCLEE